MTGENTGDDPLITRYRGLICDLDGVVYRGPSAVPHAVATLNHVTSRGVPVVFATNNASRPPEDVSDHLRGLGVAPRGWSVVTSSQAAAAYLAERLGRGTPVFAVGGPGVARALTEAGLTPVRVAELDGAPVEAVVQGLGTDVTWRELAAVGRLADAGATWVATNVDLTLPTPYGRAPGNGALVALVRTATSASPTWWGNRKRRCSTWPGPGSGPCTPRPWCAGTCWTPTSRAPTRQASTRCSS